MLGEKYHDLIAAFQQWAERRAMRKWGRLPEETLPMPVPLCPCRRQWQAFGFAGGVFLAALAAPGIGRVTRQEVGLSLPLGSVQTVRSLWTGVSSPMQANYPQAHKQSLNPELMTDLEIQVAKGMFIPDEEAPHNDTDSGGIVVYNNDIETKTQKQRLSQSLPALRTVMARFPNSPLPRAAFLTRVCNFGSLNMIIDPWRGDTQVTPSALPVVRPTISIQDTSRDEFISTRSLLKQCEQVAQEGEGLEPDNAYFPIMLAHLHFAAANNQAALADIDRASRKPRWEDYNGVLIRGASHLHDAQLGMSSSVLHQTSFDTAFFLYYGFLYETTRHLLLLAWKQEHAGNLESGIALRGRMMRIGATIRDQAHGRFVSGPGEAMFLFACNRIRIEKGKYVPGPLLRKDVADYPQYLRHHNHAAEADWVQSQFKYFPADDTNPSSQDNSTSYDAKNLPVYEANYEPEQMMHSVMCFWGAGLFTLAEIMVFLLIGGLAMWQNYRRRYSLNRPRPLARPVVWGIGLALLMIVCVLIVMAFGMAQGLAAAIDTLPIIGLLCLTLLVAGLMRGARDTALSALLTFTLACVLMGTAFVQIGGALLKADELQAASSLYETMNLHGGNLRAVVSATLFMTLGILTPLLLIVLWMAIRNRIRRVPLGWGVWRGLSTALLPLLSLLLIGYAWIGMATTRAEAQADNALLQTLDNENRYIRDLYREARSNAQQTPAVRALRLLTGDIHAANVFPPDTPKPSASSR